MFELGASPVAALGIIPDGSIALHAKPLRKRSVLAHLLGQEHFHLEGLNGTHFCFVFSINNIAVS